MEGTWNIYQEGRTVGECRGRTEGLYCCFDCICHPASRAVAVLYLRTEEDEYRLGIPVPEGDGFRLRTRVAARKLPAGEPGFFLETGESRPPVWVTLRPGEKLCCLSRLEQARFVRRNQVPGLEFPRETGRNST